MPTIIATIMFAVSLILFAGITCCLYWYCPPFKKLFNKIAGSE